MTIPALTGIALATVTLAQAAPSPWIIYRDIPGAKVSTVADSPSGAEAMCFQFRRTETPYAVFIRNEDPPLRVTAQHKLVFWLRGETGNADAKLGVALSVPSRKKSYCPGPKVKTTSKRWRRHVLDLNTDFGLPDAVHTVSQIKFSLDLRNCDVGQVARVWVRDIAIVEAGDLSLGDAGREFVVTAVHRPPPRSIGLPNIRVFSDIDNEDRVTRVRSAKHPAGFAEPVSGPGYRHLLTLPLQSRVLQVDSLEQSPDVMVVCRPVSGPEPIGAVREWLKAGGGLLLYGACAGYEPLLPGELHVAPHGNQRLSLSVTRPDHPLFAGITWAPSVGLVPFGAFGPADGATVLATFSDGVPAIVAAQRDNGRVLFFNFGPGKNLTTAVELYDELALRAMYWLAGHTDTADLPRIDREIAESKAVRERSVVDRTLDAADMGERDGWRLGMSADNVGRFGWAIDEGLLVGNINRHLQFTCGETSLGLGFGPTGNDGRDASRSSYEVTTANWVCKTARAGFGDRQVVIRQSILSPFVHYETEEPIVRLAFGHSPLHAAFLGDTGLVMRELDRADALADFAATAGAGWMLVWEEEASHPLLLVFEKRVEIEVERSAGVVDALVVRGGDSVGAFLAGHPFGVARVDTTAWTPSLPATVVDTVGFWHRAALAYPIDCDEVFRIDRTVGRTRIVNRFRFIEVADAWGTPPLKLAPLPPLVGYALDNGLLVTDCAPVKDTGLPTKYGPFKVAVDSEVVSYSLPVIPKERFAYVGSADEPELSAYLNTQFEHGVRWSCGGRVPFDAWTLETPRRGLEFRNIDPFAWGFGLVTALQGRVFLDAANREKLEHRMSRRFVDPVERHQYKMMARYREEPFSGLRYPVLFNSIYPNKTRYAGDFGSAVIYGDENEASTLVLMLAYLNAVQLGDVGLIRANWSYFRQAARMMLTTDDWAAHSSGCREYSAGAWIDMLNCEYPGMVHYARVAEIAGDQAAAEQGYYRAAKRMLPTLMRLYFHDYVNRHELAAFPARVVFGFSEPDGPKPARARIDGFNCAKAMDLTDYSQATCFSLLTLYASHVPHTVQTYLAEVVRPSFRQDGKWTFGFPYLKAFAFFGASPPDLRAMVRDIDEREGKRLRNDWSGMRQCDEVGAAIFRMHPDVYVTAHAPAAIIDALYADADGRVTLTLDSPHRDVPLKLRCTRRIVGVERNSEPLSGKHWSHENGVFSALAPEGRSDWELHLGERSATAPGLFPVGRQKGRP